MLAKDVFAVNDVDRKIQDLIRQLNDLIDERLKITSETCAMSRKIRKARGLNGVDLTSVDLTVESPTGLSIKSAKKSSIRVR